MNLESDEHLDWSKHKFLRFGLLGFLSLLIPASLMPFFRTWLPSAATKLTEAAVRVDISHLRPGQMMTVLWQGKPVWIMRRSETMKNQIKQNTQILKDATSKDSEQPQGAQNAWRSLHQDYFVVLGKCTHLGCVPIVNLKEGIICPCHGSRFDFAGRVLRGSPANKNLVIPQHHFSQDGKTIIIGAAV